MKKLNRTENIAVHESMKNLSDYVSTLDMKTDMTLYLKFESIINETFDLQINNISKD